MADSSKRNALPHLQSLVLVLWKIVFTNVSYLVAQANGQNGIAVPNGVAFPDDNPENGPGKRKLNPNAASHEDMADGNPAEFEHEGDPVMEELNAIRLREISTKAISGVLLTLLRWFKLSRMTMSCFILWISTDQPPADVLKFEYMTQILLDANYLPLILKLFAHQDVDRAVDQRNDRDELKYTNSIPQIHEQTTDPLAASSISATSIHLTRRLAPNKLPPRAPLPTPRHPSQSLPTAVDNPHPPPPPRLPRSHQPNQPWTNSATPQPPSLPLLSNPTPPASSIRLPPSSLSCRRLQNPTPTAPSSSCNTNPAPSFASTSRFPNRNSGSASSNSSSSRYSSAAANGGRATCVSSQAYTCTWACGD